MKTKKITSSMEDYLEAIFNLGQEKNFVRVKDIARKMGVKMPTVTSMLKNLRDRGFVHYEKYEFVELTESGNEVGKDMSSRHELLFTFLKDILKIDLVTADEDACRMEHALSAATLESLIDFMEFLQTCPRVGMEWIDRFEEFRNSGKDIKKFMERAIGSSCSVKKDLI